jgi:cytochrome c oxidase cbb3-type subunit 2
MGLFGLHYKLERKTMSLAIGIIIAASIGGLIEIVPLFTIHQTVEDAPEHARLHAARDRRPQHLYP